MRVIKEYFLKLLSLNTHISAFPITNETLLLIIKLCQARAKADWSLEVQMTHVEVSVRGRERARERINKPFL